MNVSLKTQIAMISFVICLFGAIIVGGNNESRISRVPFAGTVCSFIISSALLVKDND